MRGRRSEKSRGSTASTQENSNLPSEPKGATEYPMVTPGNYNDAKVIIPMHRSSSIHRYFVLACTGS